MAWEYALTSLGGSAHGEDVSLAGVWAGLPSWGPGSPRLEEALSQVREEFPVASEIRFRVIVAGTPRPLRPTVADEVYRIGREALCNAFRHSHARDIEVELEYAVDGLRLLVRDNGSGIDLEVLRSRRDAPWGLTEMKERTQRIGGRLRVLSHSAAGTEIELSVPGQMTFAFPAEARSVRWLSRVFS